MLVGGAAAHQAWVPISVESAGWRYLFFSCCWASAAARGAGGAFCPLLMASESGLDLPQRYLRGGSSFLGAPGGLTGRLLFARAEPPNLV